MSYVIFLNTAHGLSYKSSCNGLEKIAQNQFGAKLCPKSFAVNNGQLLSFGVPSIAMATSPVLVPVVESM